MKGQVLKLSHNCSTRVSGDRARNLENTGGAWSSGEAYERWHARKFPRRQGRKIIGTRTLRSRKILKKNKRR